MLGTKAKSKVFPLNSYHCVLNLPTLLWSWSVSPSPTLYLPVLNGLSELQPAPLVQANTLVGYSWFLPPPLMHAHLWGQPGT